MCFKLCSPSDASALSPFSHSGPHFLSVSRCSRLGGAFVTTFHRLSFVPVPCSSNVYSAGVGMAQEYPLSDTCLLYACYRGHGKVIERSNWYTDYRETVVRHHRQQLKRHHEQQTGNASAEATGLFTIVQEDAESTGTKGTRKRSARILKRAATAIDHGDAEQGDGSRAGNGSASNGRENTTRCPPAADLRARFNHASNELAFLGYVKAWKRRRRDKARGQGPKGAVTRLVYAYTMEGGAL